MALNPFDGWLAGLVVLWLRGLVRRVEALEKRLAAAEAEVEALKQAKWKGILD